MAATYTEISLEDMEKFLKRGFRALRPKQGTQNSEYYYDLHIGDNVAIRVWSSVKKGSGFGAGSGQDAIRIQLVSSKTGRPLMKGKAPIVKRTQNWRDSLQNRIEDMVEVFDEKEAYWEQAAGRPAGDPGKPRGTGPTDKQVGFVMALLRKIPQDEWESRYKVVLGYDEKPDEDFIRNRLSVQNVSSLIDALLRMGAGRRFTAGELSDFM